MSTTVLLADREPLTHGFLERHLRFDGFEIVAPSGARPDLVIAAHDAELERWCGEAPVIVLGSHEPAPDEPVRAFRRGCDDYLARPFRYDELVERIRAVLRRSGAAGRRFLVAGPLRVDLEARLATVRAQPLALSQEGVRADRPARRRPETGLHQGGAAAGRLRLPVERPHANARLTRLAAAPQAAPARPRDVVPGERVGGRLPAGRSPPAGIGSSRAAGRPGPRERCDAFPAPAARASNAGTLPLAAVSAAHTGSSRRRSFGGLACRRASRLAAAALRYTASVAPSSSSSARLTSRPPA